MESLLQDLRYGFRILFRNPGFTVIAVLSLSLGIGANSTIFSVIHTVMLRPLPYKDRERLVAIFETNLEQGQPKGWVATSNFFDWKRQNEVFDQMEWIAGSPSMNLIGSGEPARVEVQYVTPNLLQLLGVQPVLGRTFREEDLQLEDTVVLSHSFWQRQFGGDEKVFAQKLFLDGKSVTVIGVLSPGFDFFGENVIDLWKPQNPNSLEWLQRSERSVFALARLRPGVSLTEAQAEMDLIARQLELAYPETNKGWGVKVQSLQEALAAGEGLFKEIFFPLFGVVAFVLLIACANVANLLLARNSTRKSEMAIRASLGAGQFRIARQLLTESVLLGLLGGLFGLLVVNWGIKLFVALAPQGFPHAQEIQIDSSVLGFTLACALLTGIVFGLTPALQASRPDLTESLKEGSRSLAVGSRHMARNILVVIEVSLALVLLMGTGLMVKSLLRIHNAHPGFNPENLLTMEVSVSGPKYVMAGPKRGAELRTFTPQMELFSQRVLERITALPGVDSAAMIDRLPMTAMLDSPMRTFAIAGRQVSPSGEQFEAMYNVITPNYFTTMQTPLLKGRSLDERDVAAGPWVIVINEAMARKFWPDQNPIGEVITLDIVKEERPREIVGVVGNIRQYGLSVEPLPGMFVSHWQQPGVYPDNQSASRLHRSLVIRTEAMSTGLVSAARRAIAEVDKDQPVYGVRNVKQLVTSSDVVERFYMLLLGIFATMALLLATIGIYGVMAYSVQERTHEIGIRMALGGHSRQVLRLVLKQGMTLSLIGIAVGLVGSFALTPILSNFLFGVKAHDPVTFIGVSLILLSISLLATYIPARKATTIDPMVALRYE